MLNPPVLLPVWDSLSEAWNKVKGFKGTIWAAFLLIFVILFGLALVQVAVEHFSSAGGKVFAIINQIMSYILSAGLGFLGIRRSLDIPVDYKDSFSVLKDNKPWKLIGMVMLQTLLYIPGILLIVASAFGAGYAGIIGNGFVDYSNVAMVVVCVALFLAGFFLVLYFAVRTWLAIGFIVDQSVGSIIALKKAFQASRGNFWRMVGFMLMQLVIMMLLVIPIVLGSMLGMVSTIILGLIVSFVGFVWILPWLYICYGMMYKRLSVNADAMLA